MKVGTFSKNEDGVIAGKVHAVGLGFFDTLFEAKTDKDGDPYFKIIADPAGSRTEVGTAWPHEKDGGTYYSINMETTATPNALSMALFPDKYNAGKLNMVFDHDRQTPKADVKTEAGQEQSVPVTQTAPEQKKPGLLRRRSTMTP